MRRGVFWRDSNVSSPFVSLARIIYYPLAALVVGLDGLRRAADGADDASKTTLSNSFKI
jgi:hypothetical protein